MAFCTMMAPVVEFFIHKVHRASCYFYAVAEGLLLRFQSRKRRQQRWMDIQNAPRKLLHEPGREQAHISSQANEVDLVLPQGGYNFAIVFFALFALGRNNHRGQTESAGRFNSAGVKFVGDDDGDAGARNLSRGHILAMASKLEPRPERRMPRFFMKSFQPSAFSNQPLDPIIIIY